MKENIKKIMITTLCSMTIGTTIGCANSNTKIAQKINNGVDDFVSSINKLDYVDTQNTSSNLGKIVSAYNETKLFNSIARNTNIENTITKPSERTDNFKLYILSETPYISLTSTDNSVNLSMQFSTEKIETTSEDISEKINKLILKRAILMVYVNEIYSGNVTLTEENKKAINAYVNAIKENASFLNGNRGMVKNQLGLASDLIQSDTNNDIINYYIIKSGEALEIRSNKIDSTLSAIESIITILEQNLNESSCYYQNTLTTKYDNMIADINNSTNTMNDNSELAKSIAESINMINPSLKTNTQNTTNNLSSVESIKNQNNSINNTTNTRRKNNNYINNKSINNSDYNPTTLEEKTQHSTKIIENQPSLEQTTENINKLTPSQRAKQRRQERLNRQRKQNELQNKNLTETQNINNNTTPEQPSNNYISPQDRQTIRADRTQIKNNNQNENTNQNINNHKQTNVNLQNRNNAIRVPYKNQIQ